MLSELAVSTFFISISGIALICVFALSTWTTSLRKVPYPPGPPPKSLISGHKDELTVPFVWRKFSQWAKEYGSVLYLRSFGQPIIVLDSLQDSVELLERRSRIYSSRPYTPMYDLMSFAYGTAMREYGPDWRKHRRMFQQSFKPDSSAAYRPIQVDKLRYLLRGLLDTPDNYESHLNTFAGAIILSVIYGYDVKQKDDYYVKLVESVRDAFSQGPSLKWRVNSFAALRYVPSWFPGAGFRRYANIVKRTLTEQREAPFRYAMTSELLDQEGKYSPVVCRLLGSCRSETEVRLLKEAAGSAYGAGVGTTVGAIMVFFEAMITYPEVQKKAREELDRVTGGDRLPEFKDQASLPYLQAVVREVIRWRPIFPLGLPHASTEDDIYNGHFIPKGSIVRANIWAITRDPARYENPETFNPARFFTETGELKDDEVTYVFGFGRRICPGRHLATASVWLVAATVLATFDIGYKKDADGHNIPLNVEYAQDGVINFPLPFECSLTPRSEKTRGMIMELS